jgi:GT2 family glycosyltransferase
MEEIDLCWRLKNKNFSNKIVVIGNSNVYHLGGGTLNYNTVNKHYLNFRNSLIMLIKNLPKKLFIFSLSGRFFIDLLIFCFSILTFKFKLATGIIKAYLYITFNILKIKRKTLTRKSNFKFYYCKSIVYNFFIKRKKTFSEI